MKKFLFLLAFILCSVLYFSLTPSLYNQTQAEELVDFCDDAGGFWEGPGKFYCHCAAGKIVCPLQGVGFGGDTCTPFQPIPPGQKVGSYSQCLATQTCVDDGPPNDAKVKTPKNPRCVTKQENQTNCTCTNEGSLKPNENGRKCNGAAGPTDFCGTGQYCSKGKCENLVCACRHASGTDSGIVCKKPGDSTPWGEEGTSNPNLKETKCPADNLCVRVGNKATCENNSKVELGKCTCTEPGKTKAYTCQKEGNAEKEEKECDTNAVCVADSTTPTGINCKSKLVTLQPTLPAPPPPPCANKSADGKCTSFLTAFGTIDTNPEKFIVDIFAILLSISGAIALLLIMRAGYTIMTSQGKPDQLQSGREQFIAAVVGLMFLIFSFVILQVIGVDILKIPTDKGVVGGASCTTDPGGGTQGGCPDGYACNASGAACDDPSGRCPGTCTPN